MTAAPGEGPSTPLVIGHRGAPGYRPEHSASSYRIAIDAGADAVEPDIVPTRDGVLVIRHENEIGGTTDVAEHPEFADRRVSKTVDGTAVTGWFTEDFTWDELQRLTLRERLPKIRPENTRFDGQERMLRLEGLLALLRVTDVERGTRTGLVVEIKHPTYFASVGLDCAQLLADALRGTGWSAATGLVIECFELDVLRSLQRMGVDARYVYLIEGRGTPADRAASAGAQRARSFADDVTDAGLGALAEEVDGISVDLAYLRPGTRAHDRAPLLVERAHERGLVVFTWTLRPENRFLRPEYRIGTEPAVRGNWRREFADVMATGVDGVFADHPDLAISVRRTRG